MHTFDHTKNPYAADLLHIALAPEGRYSHHERLFMGNLIAGKLYNLEFIGTGRGWFSSMWRTFSEPKIVVDMHVVYEQDNESVWALVRQAPHRLTHHQIVISAGENGVHEVLNVEPGDFSSDKIVEAINRIQQSNIGRYGARSDSELVIFRSDQEASDHYNGIGGNDDGDNGGNGGRGSRGGFNDDGIPPGGVPGAGGTGELVDHHVLFTIDPELFDAILEQI